MRLKPLAVPLAPIAEQTEIVRRASAALARVEAVGRALAAQMGRVNDLDQATLAKAFRGELVPRDPNDEPAGALLEQRAAKVPAKRHKLIKHR